MRGQISIFDFYGKPESSHDEIIRYSNEARFTRNIKLFRCCDVEPEELFISCKEYFIRCPICKRKTNLRKHLYEAMHEWNWMMAGRRDKS